MIELEVNLTNFEPIKDLNILKNNFIYGSPFYKYFINNRSLLNLTEQDLPAALKVKIFILFLIV